ncbi:peptidylprolyl isomerase [Mitsuaria sp. GD03876]|uniref:peptidylprolyl isomerase n=1 Tax=Mitsuaria sp. GD03876 TaxID=2975399 RepID=UPI00244B9FEF|nr:peptidylprolyl isomerase [Mitsuaria sp. GD03876]MDH0863874.1 peptidylprolyl isomerase [Mitsuaria sp. GD03876]
MFDFVRKHTRLFQFLLLILILPSFVLLGVEGYSRFMDGSNATVATVDGRKITQAEWDQAQRQQVERMREQAPTMDPKMFESPEVRKDVLENLLRERVLGAVVADEHRSITDEQLLDLIRTDPQLAPLRNPETAKQIAAQQGLTVDGLLQRLRQDLQMNSVLAPLAQSALPTQASAGLAFDALLQQREVQFQPFAAQVFAATLVPKDADLEAYYKDPKVAAKFQLAESADIEYVALDAAALQAGVTVSADEVQKFYDNNKTRYTSDEERRASHILIKAGADMSAADKAKAKAKAESLLAEARKNPAGFAELAKKNSEDPGSAERGGDLDFFGKGAMVKPFEDAVYALKKGEISNVVQSDFGYHIIMLTDLRGGQARPFETVKAEIEAELRRQLAQKRYTEMAEDFGNTVYEQSDSLKPAADKFKLTIQKATVRRKPAPDATGPLASAKLLEAVFEADTLKNKRNTAAIEAGGNQLVSARVVEYKPARVPALAEVKPAVTAAWVQEHAAQAARKAGEARLAELQKGGDAKGLSEPVTVSRAKPGVMPQKVLDAVMRADASKLPAYVGVDGGDGNFLVVKIEKVLARDPALIDAKRAAEQYARAWSAVEMQGYYNALKAEYKATIKPAALKATAASAPAN